MDAKGAAQRARQYAAEMFADEDIQNLGLEEIVFDGKHEAWNITVGFFRPWDRPKNFAASSRVTTISSMLPATLGTA